MPVVFPQLDQQNVLEVEYTFSEGKVTIDTINGESVTDHFGYPVRADAKDDRDARIIAGRISLRHWKDNNEGDEFWRPLRSGMDVPW